jgi:hypothetical protein
MGEAVLDHAGKLAPFGLERRVRQRIGLVEVVLQAVDGTSVMPPSRPFDGRVRTSTKPSARVATNDAPRRSLPSTFGALRGNVSASPRARAWHAASQGQMPQAGFFGVQMVAPRSIRLCVKSPKRRPGSSASARARISVLAAGNSVSMA